jgi:putative ATPase
VSGLFEEPAPERVDPLAPAPDTAPLAERMRPRSLDEYVGQRHLVGAGKILERVLAGDLRQSLILWGPFSAVLSGIKEIKAVMAEAAQSAQREGKPTLLFIDEIHRFNKAQQDAFLPHVERGDVLLIGATTENPSFEVVGPLLSRARTIILQPLSEDELVAILRSAVEHTERGLAGRVRVSDDDLRTLAQASDGDARRALTLLETAATLLGGEGEITPAVLAEALQRKVLRYDKSGDQHYDLVSALHKSIRNSDRNASVYWITRMLAAGEDRRYLARRLIRMAYEDVGLADPFAARVALDAADTFDRLGTPEGDLALVQVAVYLAQTKKSNAVYRAYGLAREDVERTSAEEVPLHLRNAPTKLMKAAGYGKGYRYAHDDLDAVREMTCLPPGLEGRDYFQRG